MSLIGVQGSRDIGATHDELLRHGIHTKSSIKQYARCPIQWERRHVHGEKEPPAWAVALGNIGDKTFETWCRRKLEGKGFSVAEARALMHDIWKEQITGVKLKPPIEEPFKSPDKKIGVLMKGWKDWLRKHPSWGMGKLLDVQPAFGYDGKVLLGSVPIAGHPDSLWERGPADFKVTKSTSPTRTGGLWSNLLELVFQSVGLGRPRSSLFVMIHDFKSDRNDKAELVSETIGPKHVEVAAQKVESVVDAIKAGKFPATVEVGKYPCTPLHCGYFGKTCPVTKNLKPEEFQRGKR